MEVEPNIPQFVNRTRPLQIIPKHEMEKYEKVRKQNVEHFQRLHGKYVNILEGLELHTNVFTSSEQDDIVELVFLEREMGRAGQLRRRTYSEPRKWKRGKGRFTIQYGCCYNFAQDKEGNLPRIICHNKFDPLPSFIKRMIKRLVTLRILPADSIPNSCIVNIYEIVGDGEFRGSIEIPLPVRSILILKGNVVDIAKHCIPGVPCAKILQFGMFWIMVLKAPILALQVLPLCIMVLQAPSLVLQVLVLCKVAL
ncbi:uncharacterized protein LOC110038211 [Phalaenopsis equestris]|uniref:uncharacterized protein LOC110038211 n=1 Tax=Phalaenopsis equestris TaxID=78828 RepID=UPI0009E5AFFD|nr:uncharacterized protein LOC110038211 [Phalaenopsis equestris]